MPATSSSCQLSTVMAVAHTHILYSEAKQDFQDDGR